MSYPPIVAKVVCVDFDGTIVPWGNLEGPKEPFLYAKEALDALRAEGYYIAIFTSRLSPHWLYSEGLFYEDQEAYIKNVLDEHDIPYDRLTGEKIPAEVYFDDKAIRVSPDFPLYVAVATWLTNQPATDGTLRPSRTESSTINDPR